MADDKSTEQDSVTPPTERNPTGKGGFGDHPEHRNPGGWNKEQSISYQYNLLMRMKPDELKNFKPETIAQKIALQRIKTAITNEGLSDTKEITDRTEGKAPQFIGLGGQEEYNKLLVEFLDAPDEDTNTS